MFNVMINFCKQYKLKEHRPLFFKSAANCGTSIEKLIDSLKPPMMFILSQKAFYCLFFIPSKIIIIQQVALALLQKEITC